MYSFHQSYIYVYLMFGFQCLTDYFFEYLVMNKTTGNFPKYYIFNNMWGVFEQLASYTTRYQESDLHLAFILLNLLTTSAYTTSTLLFLLFSISLVQV